MSLPALPLPSVPVNVFTRAPVPGRTKTRLIPVLGAKRAAELAARMTRRTLERAVEADLGPLTLWCAPGPDAFLRALAQEFGAGLRTQSGGDLGGRMRHALRRALEGHPAALLVGSDCPSLSAEDLRRARSLLLEGNNRAVLGPACDGGYYLIALREVDESLFEDIPWGGERVLELTRRRLEGLGWRWAELATRPDVDRPGDLVHAKDLLSLPGEPPAGGGAGCGRRSDAGIRVGEGSAGDSGPE